MLILAAIPLGNPADASTNLREAIVSAKFIAAEDSRKFSRLCSDLGITYSAKIISFFEGNEIERLDELVAILESDSDLLVVTDAGMPGIIDLEATTVEFCERGKIVFIRIAKRGNAHHFKLAVERFKT